MNLARILPQRPFNFPSLAKRIFVILTSAALAFLFLMIIFLLGVRLFFSGTTMPGVYTTGINLQGLTQEQIETTLRTALTYPENGLIVLRDGDQVWTTHPMDIGVLIDFSATARQALAVGRQGDLAQRLQDQITAWRYGFPISPIVVADQVVGSFYLQGLAQQIDQPTVEATVTVDGTDIIAQSGQIGRRLDIQGTLEKLTAPINLLHDANIDLVIEETPPAVLDASEATELAREILSQPLTLTADGADPLIIEPRDLAAMLRFTIEQNNEGAYYQVSLDPISLSNTLEPLAPDLERRPENARFIFNDDTRELDLFQPAVIGRSLDISETIDAINVNLANGLHETPLTFVITQPIVGDDATASDLGITEAVSVVSTYFSGSSSERIQNIRTASSAFHGLLVAPGEALSMADVLGDISLDSGYAEALIIFGDRTIKGVGGGVCQVSTTLFRAVFFGGYPITERHSHAYRVGYYEIGPNSPGPGLDATVFVPMVDFKFTNDTPYWLLLETYIYNNRQLQWKFYSTSDGREITWSSRTSNEVEAPKPLYKENPDLEKGEIVQVDYEADGLDVVVYRTVTRGSEVLYRDTIKTHYLPWRAIYEYGPGTKLPKDAETE